MEISNRMMGLINMCRSMMDERGFFFVQHIHEVYKNNFNNYKRNSKIIDQFRKSYEAVTGEKLIKKNVKVRSWRGAVFFLDAEKLELALNKARDRKKIIPAAKLAAIEKNLAWRQAKVIYNKEWALSCK